MLIYAVKELNKELLKNINEDINTNIEQEIEILSKINHPNIVKYYGTFEKKNCLNIVLEYCNGGSLSKLLKHYKFDENMIRNYISQILDGLEYLHIHNIIHRDIKCANILMHNSVCKLTDFGSAKILKGDINQTASMKGTLNWMAPEIMKSEVPTRYSDIWSIGCTVIEMFDKPPYSDKQNLNIIRILENRETPKIPEGMSELLKDFVKKCLVFEGSKRLNVYELKRHPFLDNDDTISFS